MLLIIRVLGLAAWPDLVRNERAVSLVESSPDDWVCRLVSEAVVR